MSAVAAGLRAAADLIEQHPELPTPYITSDPTYGAEVFWFLQDDGADQKATAQSIIRALGGKWNKGGNDASMNFRQTVGPLKILVQVERDAVCERVVVGTETVTHPAKPAEPERTETVDKVEWVCEPVLAEATS